MNETQVIYSQTVGSPDSDLNVLSDLPGLSGVSPLFQCLDGRFILSDRVEGR